MLRLIYSIIFTKLFQIRSKSFVLDLYFILLFYLLKPLLVVICKEKIFLTKIFDLIETKGYTKKN